MPLSPAHVGLHGTRLAHVREAMELMNAKILRWDKSPRQVTALITPSVKLTSDEETAFARLYLEVGWEGVYLRIPSADSRLRKTPASVIVTLYHYQEDCANLRTAHTRATMLALEKFAHRGL